MSKHSPGPWKDLDKGSGDYLILSPKDGEIGFVQGEANARLIAAAPDMLEALKIIEFCGHEGMCPDCRFSEDTGHHEKCVLGNAIAKAEGDQK